MPTTPRSQMKLASDPNFLRRLTSLLVQEAIVVADEPDATANHKERRQLSQAIISNPPGMAASLAPTITNATNLIGADTSFNFEADATETAADDAAIRSQIATLWDTLAGV